MVRMATSFRLLTLWFSVWLCVGTCTAGLYVPLLNTVAPADITAGEMQVRIGIGYDEDQRLLPSRRRFVHDDHVSPRRDRNLKGSETPQRRNPVPGRAPRRPIGVGPRHEVESHRNPGDSVPFCVFVSGAQHGSELSETASLTPHPGLGLT